MKFQSALVVLAVTGYSAAFAPATFVHRSCASACTSTTALDAIGVLARKAKEADIRKYCEEGVPDDVMEIYKKIKANAETPLDTSTVGPLQQSLTKRKGTISVIAEYKRKIENGGFIDEIFDPEILSPSFREFGANGIAVMADERMGGCSYDDLAEFIREQQTSRGEMPGPVAVVNNDLIVDEVQIARSAAVGADAVTVVLGVVGGEKLVGFLKAAQACGLETIVSVGSKEEAQEAVELGARIISVVGVEGPEAKYDCIDGLEIPEGEQVCTIANIGALNDKSMGEIEEAWICRDKGFNCCWISDALYKSGMDASEHPGAILRSMTAKSSVKWASPKARSGKGEGAREYLGDILM